MEVRRRKVLLVDDDATILRAIARFLRRRFDVTTAGGGDEALSHLRSGARFDAIVSDVVMPDIDGKTLHEEITRIAPDQVGRVVFITGGSLREQLEEFLAGKKVVIKPILFAELERAIDTVAGYG